MKKRKKTTYAAKSNAKNGQVRYDANGRPVVPRNRSSQSSANGRPVPVKRRRVGYEKYERWDELDFDRHAYARERAKESKHRREVQKNRKSSRFGAVLVVIQALVSIIFFMLVYFLNMLPFNYMAMMLGILLALWGIVVLSQRVRIGRGLGKFISILLIITLSVGSAYVWKTHDFLNIVTVDQPTTKASEISLVVMNDSWVTELGDLSGGRFGIQKTGDRNNTDKALADLENELDEVVKTIEYDSLNVQVQALYNGRVDAIIINEAYRPLIKEDYKKFDNETRVLATFTYHSEVEQTGSRRPNIQVEEEPFIIYLSGNDQWGEVALDNGRTDVNIIATVNPTTKQILLTTTPRDYYIELPFYSGCMDKLTHAGLYGIDISMQTLEDLYDIEIDYYVRINFSGFQNLIDALDGVTVYSEYDFTAYDGTHFDVGENYVYGAEALAFVRERYSFSNGDMQRGRNQMAMIQAIADKVVSPSILTNFMPMLDSLAGCFITNMPSDKMSDLVRMQLEDGAEWNIVSNSVIGYVNSRTTYSMGNTRLDVIDPDEADVEQAKNLIRAVMNGEIIQTPEKDYGLQLSSSYDEE